MNNTEIQDLPNLPGPDSAPRIVIIVNSPASAHADIPEKTSNIDVWSPLQELSGVVKLTSRVPLTIEHIQITFEGTYLRSWESRVHTQSVGKDDQRKIITRKSTYKFLTQSLDLNDFEISNDTRAEVYVYSSPFRFIISKWATPRSGSAPRQCLSLPPTFRHGPTLTDDAGTTSYAQPQIEYNLKVVAALTDSQALEGTIKLCQQLEIPIRPAPEVFPPCDTGDWLNDFIVKQSHPFRASTFSFQKYTMVVGTQEPAPVMMVDDHPFGTTEVTIRFSVTASISNVDPQGLATLLQRIGFRIIPGLRAKTFYSTRPFPKLPAQSILTANDPHRLHDQVLKLEQVNRTLTSWRLIESNAVPLSDEKCTLGSTVGHKTHSAKTSPTPVAVWQSNISFPVKVSNDVTPTFCSAIAARQYSLVILLKATGISVGKFVLEVPIQIVSAPTPSSQAQSSELGDGPFEVSEPDNFQPDEATWKTVWDDPPPKYM
ncbi:uncharacterized protein Z519_12011 [Cladophialophora bantiana CBS 173.52]|uniref:Arrestin-like N-terminal domain-containing protein n=1 Tax=Cladophialophora bantiana (strain ATCC 10958 / CBS 173.52 / CDC B-1940 / NIH 8579) TaxID=1442370 RepID=A0A0D2H918_CLAB1|nr:uncharacterized protein Z519_12011 [Cladophialophora bantiana CBS 173.52]KIW87375.1 hypothetical protein Z519_12011 [Cladophialophora bantiana CBS 173.52]